MGNFRAISQEIKEQVIKRIREEGVTASQAARDAGVSVKTVYGWMSKGIAKDQEVIKTNRLRRENQMLLTMIGKLVMEKEQSGMRKKK